MEREMISWETPDWMPLANGWLHDLPRDRWEFYQGGEMVAWIGCEVMHSMGVTDPAEAVRRMAR